MITNPFEAIFQKSLLCTGDSCDLGARKDEAIGWIKSWVAGTGAGGTGTAARLQLARNSGVDIVYNIGTPGSTTCYAHCSIDPGNAPRNTRCRIMTPADPNLCTQTIISVSDVNTNSPGQASWNKGETAFNAEEFQEIRQFLNNFEDCNPGSQPPGFQNTTLRGLKTANMQVGFLDGPERKKRYGVCVVNKTQQGRDAEGTTKTKLSAMRQPSGLDALLFATPNPRFGGSLNPEQCKDALNIQEQVCINKFNDRNEEKMDPVGISFASCSGLSNRVQQSTCRQRLIRDACAGITNWDAKEPDTLVNDSTSRFGVPDKNRHCVIPAGAIPAGAIPAGAGLVRTDANTTLEAVTELASSLPTQTPATTQLGQRFTDTVINSRMNTCMQKCNETCTQADSDRRESHCTQQCESMLLNDSIKDDFSNTEITCDLPVDCKVQWGQWGACRGTLPPYFNKEEITLLPGYCLTGRQTRSGTVVEEPTSRGAACPPLQESRECKGSYVFRKNLFPWSYDPDVIILQRFLNTFIPTTVVSQRGMETNHFGSKTIEALKVYQGFGGSGVLDESTRSRINRTCEPLIGQ